MPITRYTVGNSTVTLSGELEAFVRKAVEAAGGQAAKIMEEAAEAVASSASGSWYGKVDKETGLSGRIDTVTTISDREIRVSVGSTDTRTAKNGKPLAVYVHEPRATSLIPKEVSREEYFSAKSKGLPVSEYPFILVANPKAASGKFLLQQLVKGPMKARSAEIAPKVAKAIKERLSNG